MRTIDPRRIELNRQHSREMGLLFASFLDAHPDVESEVDGEQLTAEEDAACGNAADRQIDSRYLPLSAASVCFHR
ncbi:hypothetical protein [Micromonospora musae]|uniref:hypothetical protein n=1 Tax=Micromonospora musae TaxID=1894970 RepID=UPI0033CC0591